MKVLLLRDRGKWARDMQYDADGDLVNATIPGKRRLGAMKTGSHAVSGSACCRLWPVDHDVHRRDTHLRWKTCDLAADRGGGRTVLKFGSAALGLLLAAGCAVSHTPVGPAPGGGDEPVVIYSVQGDYDEVWQDLEMALEERGLVISSISHVGEMIDRTGQALGRTREVFSRAKVMAFCSAVISRDMLEKNPHLIAFCPYEITVYSLPGEAGKIYLSYRRPIWKNEGDQQVLDAVVQLTDGIIQDVVDAYPYTGP
jgi:uncharacterized protein (DUF302 family)